MLSTPKKNISTFSHLTPIYQSDLKFGEEEQVPVTQATIAVNPIKHYESPSHLLNFGSFQKTIFENMLLFNDL